MIRILLVWLALAAATSAEEFYLVDAEGNEHGPFSLRADHVLVLKGERYTMKPVPQEEAAMTPVATLLDQVVIKEFSCEDVDARDILARLQHISRTQDPQGRGLPMRIDLMRAVLEDETATLKASVFPRWTLEFRDTRLRDILRIIDQMPGVAVDIGPDEVVIRDE